MAIGKNGTAIVDLVVFILGKTDQDRDAKNLVANFGNCRLDAVPQTGVKQQILRWIPADAKFRKNYQVGALYVARARRVLNDFCGVAGDVPYREINLRQCNFDAAVHPRKREFLLIENRLHF